MSNSQTEQELNEQITHSYHQTIEVPEDEFCLCADVTTLNFWIRDYLKKGNSERRNNSVIGVIIRTLRRIMITSGKHQEGA
jgi:hypothetical protein